LRLIRRASFVEKLAMPQLENGEVKDLLGIASGANILRKHSFYSALLKISARGGFGAEKEIVNPIFEILAKPSFIRNGKASLFTVEDFARNAVAKSLLGDVFGVKPRTLKFCGRDAANSSIL